MARPRNFETDDVLDRSMRLFWRKGYAGSTMDDLEKATGLKRVSLYNAFGNKKDLFVTILRRYRSTVVATVLAPLREPGAGLDAVGSIFRRLRGSSAQPGPGGCLMVNTSVDRMPLQPDIERQVNEHFEALENAFAKALENARSTGSLKPCVDTEKAAAYLTTTHQGIAVLSRAGRTASVAAAVDVVLEQLDNWRER